MPFSSPNFLTDDRSAGDSMLPSVQFTIARLAVITPSSRSIDRTSRYGRAEPRISLLALVLSRRAGRHFRADNLGEIQIRFLDEFLRLHGIAYIRKHKFVLAFELRMFLARIAVCVGVVCRRILFQFRNVINHLALRPRTDETRRGSQQDLRRKDVRVNEQRKPFFQLRMIAHRHFAGTLFHHDLRFCRLDARLPLCVRIEILQILGRVVKPSERNSRQNLRTFWVLVQSENIKIVALDNSGCGGIRMNALRHQRRDRYLPILRILAKAGAVGQIGSADFETESEDRCLRQVTHAQKRDPQVLAMQSAVERPIPRVLMLRWKKVERFSVGTTADCVIDLPLPIFACGNADRVADHSRILTDDLAFVAIEWVTKNQQCAPRLERNRVGRIRPLPSLGEWERRFAVKLRRRLRPAETCANYGQNDTAHHYYYYC